MRAIVNLGWIMLSHNIKVMLSTIKHENNKVNTPKQFQRRGLDATHVHLESEVSYIKQALSNKVGVHPRAVDFVYFSCPHGAEEHVDALDPDQFHKVTMLVPVIVPSGETLLHTCSESVKLEVGNVYAFDHTKPHSVTVEDTESGCVLIMATAKKDIQ